MGKKCQFLSIISTKTKAKNKIIKKGREGGNGKRKKKKLPGLILSAFNHTNEIKRRKEEIYRGERKRKRGQG